MALKNYSGRDLGQDFKEFFRKEKNRLAKILKAKDCYNLEMSYGFYYFSGFFTSETGQIYYFSCSDIRHFGYHQLLIRTATSYTDYTGGCNQYCGVNKRDLMNFKLQ